MKKLSVIFAIFFTAGIATLCLGDQEVKINEIQPPPGGELVLRDEAGSLTAVFEGGRLFLNYPINPQPGSANTPGYGFNDNDQTGMFNPSSGVVGLTSNGSHMYNMKPNTFHFWDAGSSGFKQFTLATGVSTTFATAGDGTNGRAEISTCITGNNNVQNKFYATVIWSCGSTSCTSQVTENFDGGTNEVTTDDTGAGLQLKVNPQDAGVSNWCVEVHVRSSTGGTQLVWNL